MLSRISSFLGGKRDEDPVNNASTLATLPEETEDILLQKASEQLEENKSLDGSTTNSSMTTMTPSISSSVSSLSSNALARQIEMRDRVAAAFAAIDSILTATSAQQPFQHCSYWPEHFMNIDPAQEYIDGRTECSLILERRFQYGIETGKLSVSFETRPEARIKINSFRSETINEERIYWGKDLQYSANIKSKNGEPPVVEEELLRALCNDVYRRLKRSALLEIEEKMKYTASEGVYNGQQYFINVLRESCHIEHFPIEKLTETGGIESGILDSVVKSDSKDEKVAVPTVASLRGMIYWDSTHTPLPPLLHSTSPEPSTAYPFNFGVRVRRYTPHTSTSTSTSTKPGRNETTIFFYCCASDKCRKKFVSIQYDCYIPAPKPIPSLLKGTIQPPPRQHTTFRKLVERHLQSEHWNLLLATGWAPVVQNSGLLGACERDVGYRALGVKEFVVDERLYGGKK